MVFQLKDIKRYDRLNLRNFPKQSKHQDIQNNHTVIANYKWQMETEIQVEFMTTLFSKQNKFAL